MKYVLIALLAIIAFVGYTNYYQKKGGVNSVPQNIVTQEDTDAYSISAAVPLTGFEKIDNVIRLENDVLLQGFKNAAQRPELSSKQTLERVAQTYSSDVWGINSIIIQTRSSVSDFSIQSYRYAVDTGVQYDLSNFINIDAQSLGELAQIVRAAGIEGGSELAQADFYQNFYVTNNSLVFVFEKDAQLSEVVVPLGDLEQYWRGWLQAQHQTKQVK